MTTRSPSQVSRALASSMRTVVREDPVVMSALSSRATSTGRRGPPALAALSVVVAIAPAAARRSTRAPESSG